MVWFTGKFKEGKCDCSSNESCAVMGYYIDTSININETSSYYLETGKKVPFCRT